MPDSKLLFLILLALISLQAFAAITSLPGTSAPLSPSRDAQAYYHTNQDDYHLYGSPQWAVRFDFQDFYPNVPNCRFIISQARIFFPNATSQATVSLYADVDSLPSGNALRQVSSPITQQQMEFTFPDTLSASVIWLVVDYEANGTTRFISASAGGGRHSYYLNTTYPNSELQNMLASGFACELAFGLVGSFMLDSPDLELVSFDLKGSLLPGARLRPVFSIYNHAATSVSDARIRLEFTSPHNEFTVSDSLLITESIAAHDSLVIGLPGYADYSYALPDTTVQLRLKATLVSSFSEPANLFHNNTLTIYYNVFSDALPFLIAENFMQTNAMEAIFAIQDENLPDDFITLNYFPSLGDSLGNLAARNRFDWYGFNATPTLAIQGRQRIYGFPPDYVARLVSISTQAQNQHSFISRATAEVVQIPNSDNVNLDFTLTNDHTSLYPTFPLNPSLQSQFFVGLFHRIIIADGTRYVLERWIAFADTITNPLPIGSSISKSYTFNRNNLPVATLVNDYCIFFWMQSEAGGTIHYAAMYNFRPEDFPVSGDDPILIPQVRLYPNPLMHDAQLKLERLEPGSRIKIYNLKGQLLFREPNSQQSLAIPSNIFPTSGIYFIRIESAMPGNPSVTKKISYIK